MISERHVPLLAFAALAVFGAATGAWRDAHEPVAIAWPAAADWCWLKANLAWEKRDEARTRELTTLAVALAPMTDYFRVNAARMRAFDFPEWREREQPTAPSALKAAWRAELAGEALAVLEHAPGRSPELWIEAGNIALYARRDSREAAAYYRRAAEMVGAPWHAGRICGELLWRSGQRREAVEWLRAWGGRLPADEPEAQRELVLARCAEWERELQRE
ncbi:MAG: hypothetical protein KF715_01885 [Candidatus Didemnitutus sp.]|nr:hypothetical protein [Candidatus Didemnitutus sp.]